MDSWATYLDSFFNDTAVQGVILLIFLDLLLGVAAALKTDTFSLAKIAGFLKDDVALKVFPFFVLYAGAKVAGNTDVIIPGLDLDIVSDGALVLLYGAMVGSILKSLNDLGLLGTGASKVKSLVARPEKV